MGFVRAHRVLVFFVLAYALSWAAVPFGGFFAPGALVAAVVVVAATEGVVGLRTLGGRVIRWRVGMVWYVLAIGVPLLVHAVTTAANVSLGAGSPSTAQFAPWYGVLLAVGMNTVLGGPLSEEPSFRGFAQARLQGHEIDEGHLWVECRPQGMDLALDKDVSWLLRQVAAVMPDIVFLGPLYRLAPRALQTDDEAAPLIKEADPELERLLAEEEEIERLTREHHETPHFRGDD